MLLLLLLLHNLHALIEIHPIIPIYIKHTLRLHLSLKDISFEEIRYLTQSVFGVYACGNAENLIEFF